MKKTSQLPRNDEIDLLELFKALWSQKRIIALVMFACTLAATAYAFIVKPTYEVKLYTLPPSMSQIAGFNYGRNSELGMQPFDIKFIYGIFARNLNAESTRYEFFSSVYWPSLSDDEQKEPRNNQYMRFNERLIILSPAKNTPDRFVIKAQGKSPEQAETWAREYMGLAKKKAMSEMLENALSEAKVRARGLDQQIETLRTSAKNRRKDHIVRLKEALRIAQQLNLIDPPIINIGGIGREQGIPAFMDDGLMYMRGSRALEAEIANLTKRASDDPFIPELRDLQEKYSIYSHIQINPEHVAVMQQDGPVEMPERPVKPIKILIVFLGVMIGGLLGVLISFVRICLNYQRDSLLCRV